MKKLFVILFSLIAGVSYGQFTKGTFLLGGSAGANFQSEKVKTGSTTTVTGHENSVFLSPNVGYFVMDNLAAGLALDFRNSKTTQTNSDYKYTNISIALAPFARYYYQKFYGEASFAFGHGGTKTTNDGGSYSTSYNLTGWSLAAGYAYFLNESIAVEPQIGYQNSGQKTGNSKDISSGLFIHIGFQIYLRKL